MATATASRPKTSTSESTPLFKQAPIAVEATAETLLGNCSEVRVRINWFGTSAKVDAETALDMLKDTAADRKSVSIAKRLMNSKHPAMEAVKEARAAIKAHVDAWTVPMLALRAAGGDAGETRKDAGIRLIQKKDIQAYDDRLQYLSGILGTAAATLQRAMPQIMEADRERLGKLFNENDYPKDVAQLIGVEVSYKQVGVDLDWETLCPGVFARERADAREKFAAVVENAATEFATRFVDYIKQAVSQMGNRVRLNPDPAHANVLVDDPNTEIRVDIRDAEVLEKRTHAEDDGIPAGHVLVKVRLDKGERKGKSEERWLAPVSERLYEANWRPYATDERRKLSESSIAHLKEELEIFRNVGELLGPYRDICEKSVDDVRAMLARAHSGMDAGIIAQRLREGSYLREEMSKALATVARDITSAMEEATPIRRQINPRLVGEV